MAKIYELPRSKYRHICIFGEPKTGKSTLVSRLAEHGKKLLWISLDNGHGVLHKLSLAAQENIDLIILPDTADNPVAKVTCDAIMSGKEVKICMEHGRAECPFCKAKSKNIPPPSWEVVNLSTLDPDTILVFDHATQIGDSIMNTVRKGGTDYKPDWEQYAQQGYWLSRFFLAVQQCQRDIIVIAQLCEGNMETKDKKYTPYIGSANYSGGVAKYFDDLVVLTVNNKMHHAGSSTTYDLKCLTASRDDVKIETMKVPDLICFFDPALQVKSVTPRLPQESPRLGQVVQLPNERKS